MKKLFLFMMLVLGVGSANAQTFGANTWTKINCPVFSGLSSVTVVPDGRIFATSSNACHVSNDEGITWESYNISYASEYIDNAIWFKGRLYVTSEIGVISSPDGINWQLEKAGYGFPSVCANDNYLFIFGHTNNSWRTDGACWTHISQPAIVINAACASNTVLTAVSESGGPGQTQSTIYKSYNSGQSWSSAGTIPIQTQEVGANADQYTAAGYNMSHTMQSCGQYGYSYGSGDIRCVKFFNGLCLTGGSESLGGGFYHGIILENGVLETAAYFDGDIIGVSSNEDFAVADMLGSELYIRYFDEGTLSVEKQEKISFSVYPNPTVGAVYFSLPAPETIKVFSLSGSLLKEQKMPSGNNSLELSAYSPGLYIIQAGQIKAKVMKR